MAIAVLWKVMLLRWVNDSWLFL